LPNILEFDSIRDEAKGSSPYSRLPNIVADAYWSSSEYNATYAYEPGFNDGNVDVGDKGWVPTYSVRCVRG